MSALGVTEWYTAAKEQSKEVILGCYPLGFVKEAATKLGASFYLSISRRHNILDRYPIFALERQGFMMPFSARTGWLVNITAVLPHIEYGCEDHPAVLLWQIDSHGSVYIREAGRLASSTDYMLVSSG